MTWRQWCWSTYNRLLHQGQEEAALLITGWWKCIIRTIIKPFLLVLRPKNSWKKWFCVKDTDPHLQENFSEFPIVFFPNFQYLPGFSHVFSWIFWNFSNFFKNFPISKQNHMIPSFSNYEDKRYCLVFVAAPF